jgi:hypothetical protein
MPERKWLEKCEFFPTGDEPICDCGSDVSGYFECTVEYSLTCQWANIRRDEDLMEARR